MSGVVPLAAFLVLHVWTTASIVGSPEVYDRQIRVVHGGPLQALLEVVLVFLPLAYHAAYGVWRTLSRGPEDAAPHAYETDLMRSLQRASGIVVLVFVLLHVWEFRGQTWTNGLDVGAYSTTLIEHLSSTRYGVPFVAIGYVLGIAATAFHLSNGLTSFFRAWGYASTPGAERRARLLFRVLGIFVFAISTAMTLQLATGARFFPREEPKTPPICGSAVPAPLPAPSQ